ncbi:hypothetical protein FK545_02815 [Planococcus glaciei]|nr:hypothetical protein [Planococcus glaciei]QDY44834.1 hypothetical protein FK545_02815 [Planococcus glaciei]
MGILEKIYDNSPIAFQNFMVSVSGYQRNKTRYGKEYYDHLNFLKDFDTWSLKEKLNYQKKELIDFIQYVKENSIFYKELYKDIDLSLIKEIEDLKKLPVVDKEMLRENINNVTTVPKKKCC